MRGIAHMRKYIERKESQQSSDPLESPVADVKLPALDAPSPDISSQPRVSESSVADNDVSNATVSITRNSPQTSVLGSRSVRNKRPPVWKKDYMHTYNINIDI